MSNSRQPSLPSDSRLKIQIAKTILAISLSSCAMTSPHALARDYYVSTLGRDHPAAGSANDPFLTIHYAANLVTAGDTVYIAPGQYQLAQTLYLNNKTGTAELPIQFIALTNRNRRVEIDCSLKRNCISMAGSSHIRISGILFNSPQNAALYIARNNNHIRIDNNSFYFTGKYGIQIDDNLNGLPANTPKGSYQILNNYFLGNKDTSIYARQISNSTLSENHIDGMPSPTPVQLGDGIVVTLSDAVAIRSNYITGIRGLREGKPLSAIKVKSSTQVTLVNNELADLSGRGIHVLREDMTNPPPNRFITIDDNRIYGAAKINEGNNDPACTSGGWPGAMNLSDTLDAVIQNNIVHHNFGEGVILSNAQRVMVSQNDLHDNFGTNLYLNNAANIVVERNFIHTLFDPHHFRCGAAAGGISLANETDTSQNNTNYLRLENISILNNIVQGGRFGLSYYTDNSSAYFRGGMRNVQVRNNTVVVNGNGSDNRPQPVLAITPDTQHSDNLFENNLFRQMQAQDPLRSIGVAQGHAFNRNLWFGGTANDPVGSAPNDVLADPLLANPLGTAAYHFKISPASPAYNAAYYLISSNAPAVDYYGSPRPFAGNADIGAYEYTLNQ
ncbi:right-handed parallel beta-helix repeat-containing protein [Parachitinimonas caeni]|uniref:Right-handed parallel beta-helix repeat-containing protein n=1 Tax=Parachitinimonas caeni TaxID=3031301 RepID=A0ABT7E3G7_9NEIS|nr:right-handed parallel beta-helix repeat-containing protein [Parachitinimonas caeni]MDK2125950.1 right-handed parallel beta-helix repeat-containing protein [Parachitinimonas caeni]